MNEIRYVHLGQKSLIADDYISRLLKAIGNKFICISKVELDTVGNLPLIVIVNSDNLPEIKKIILERDQKLLIALKNKADFKLVVEFKDFFDKIFGFLDLTQDIEYNIPILNNYLSLNFSTKNLGLSKLADDLEKIYEHTKTELFRIKDLHDRFVKIRKDDFKGAAISSKFMAGEKSGGEFYEIIQNDYELYIIQAGSNSYLLSSLILGEMEKLKNNIKSYGRQSYLEDFKNSISTHAKENNFELSFCILNLNLKNLSANLETRGHGKVFLNEKLLNVKNLTNLKLTPKDKLYFISQGANANWDFYKSVISLESFIGNNIKLETNDLINEFFFELSRNSSGPFLMMDALWMSIEIEENVLYQLA